MTTQGLFALDGIYAKMSIYGEKSARQIVRTANGPTAKSPYGEKSSRPTVRTANCPHGELSQRQIVPTAKSPTANCPTANGPKAGVYGI